LRKRTVVVRSERGGVEVDSLTKRTMAVGSKAGVKATPCSRAGDNAAACSQTRIEDDKWWRCNSF
jgi:hypothetical protein